MRAAFLMSERALRAKLAKQLGPILDAEIDEFPTASKALTKLTSEHYELIVIHWKVHPGLGSGDSAIDELADMIPKSEYNRTLLYWEVGLRVIDLVREEDSPNRLTPVIVIFPELDHPEFGEDELTKESVLLDIERRQPAEAIFGSASNIFTETTVRLVKNKPTNS